MNDCNENHHRVSPSKTRTCVRISSGDPLWHHHAKTVALIPLRDPLSPYHGPWSLSIKFHKETTLQQPFRPDSTKGLASNCSKLQRTGLVIDHLANLKRGHASTLITPTRWFETLDVRACNSLIPQPFQVLLTLFSKSFSTFPHGTCLLSVSE